MRRVLQSVETGIPMLNQFCRSIVAEHIILPRLVVPLVKEEVCRLLKLEITEEKKPQGVSGLH
jgi:hypothetical protein